MPVTLNKRSAGWHGAEREGRLRLEGHGLDLCNCQCVEQHSEPTGNTSRVKVGVIFKEA